VKRAGPERVILNYCEKAHSLSFGQSLGIKLFQGWYVDGALRGQTV